MNNLCKFGVGKTRPKICSESGFGEVLGFVWDGFGTLWAVFWALLGALGVIFAHSKSFLFRALAQDGSKRPLASIWARFWRGLGSLKLIEICYFEASFSKPQFECILDRFLNSLKRPEP